MNYTTIDAYVDTWDGNAVPLCSGGYTKMAQSFHVDENIQIVAATFLGAATGDPPNDSPEDYIYVKIYNHSGVFGTSSVPTGEPLATSAPQLALGSTGTVFFFTGASSDDILFELTGLLSPFEGTKYPLPAFTSNV